MAQLPDSPELTPTRYRELSSYDPEKLFELLRATVVATVAWVRDGQPMVLPTAFGFDDDAIYLHGSTGSHFGRDMADGRPLSVSITTLDGFVYARTGYDSAVHYRSAVIRGSASMCEGEEKLRALEIITEHLLPGRWAELPAPTGKELAATLVLRIPLDQVSLKILDGGVEEDADDPQDWAMWAGVVPVRLVATEPITSAHTESGVTAAPSTTEQLRRFRL